MIKIRGSFFSEFTPLTIQRIVHKRRIGEKKIKVLQEIKECSPRKAFRLICRETIFDRKLVQKESV
jgi:hypothetical protein